MRIRTLRDTDIAAVTDLSDQAGWNQIRADWERLLDLNPSGCFTGILDVDLVATSTLVTFGDVGWIGMCWSTRITAGRGTEPKFSGALEAGIDDGVATIGLDATDAGRSVYRQEGFEAITPIER